MEETQEQTTWTCSMHPQIQQPEEGDCPICGMDLIPLEEESDADQGPRELRMSEASRALADIQTTEVETRFPTRTLRLAGTLGYDETRVKSLTARFPARIEELFVNVTGTPVNKGEHLAKVYSPELLTAQRELLSAVQRDPEGTIARAAREKLRLWDLLPEQIEGIVESGEARDQIELRAPLGGIVVEKQVKEGDYVKTGDSMFRIVDFSGLWLEMDAYESDLPWLRYGQQVSFTVEALPGETFTGTVVFIAPEVNRKTRTAMVRVNVPNPEGRLKPGMFARGSVSVELGRTGPRSGMDLSGKWISPMHPEIVKDHAGNCDVCGMDLVPAEDLGLVNGDADEAPLVVPASAVLRTGTRAVVYVEVPESERAAYEGREIELGPRAGEVFIVTAGLEEGERVVTNGAFKIDSALQIQAKPSLMSGEEVRGQKSEVSPSTSSGSSSGERAEVRVEVELAVELLPGYLDLQRALAGDDLEGAKTALKELMTVTGHEGEAAKLVHDMMAAEDLDGIRRPHFDHLSMAMIQALEDEEIQQQVYRMRCPMVYDDRANAAADWLQADDNLKNPYFGAMMLQCGEEVEKIGTTLRQAQGRQEGTKGTEDGGKK